MTELYVIAPSLGPCAIGYAGSAVRHLTKIQAHNHDTLFVHWHHDAVRPLAAARAADQILADARIRPGWYRVNPQMAEYACRQAILICAGSRFRIEPPKPSGETRQFGRIAAIDRAIDRLGKAPPYRRDPAAFFHHRKLLGTYLAAVEKWPHSEIAQLLQTAEASIDRWARDQAVRQELDTIRITAVFSAARQLAF